MSGDSWLGKTRKTERFGANTPLRYGCSLTKRSIYIYETSVVKWSNFNQTVYVVDFIKMADVFWIKAA